MRALFAGLFCFTILMLFVAWAGIGELVIPPAPGPGVRLVEMPGPLVALNAAMCFLPVAAFILILAGVSGMMRFIPGVGQRLVWRIGDHYITAVMVAAFILIGYVGLFAVFLGVALLALTGNAIDPAVGLAASLFATGIPIALGWYLMLLSGWSLYTIAQPKERILLLMAVAWAGLFAAMLIAAGVVASIAMGSAALAPNTPIPPRVPWADAASGVAGFAALVVLTVVARRLSVRYESADLPGTAQTA